MANKTAIEGQVILTNVRLSFPQLFEAKAIGNDPNSKPRFSSSFLMTKGDKNYKVCRAEIDRILKEKFGGKPLPADKIPLLDGNLKDYDGYEDQWYLSANRSEKQKAPTVVDSDKTPLTEKSSRPYGGCYVNAIVRFYSQGGKGDKPAPYGKRIACSLETVQFAKDGEPFGAPRASLDDLPDIEDDGADLPEEESEFDPNDV